MNGGDGQDEANENKSLSCRIGRSVAAFVQAEEASLVLTLVVSLQGLAKGNASKGPDNDVDTVICLHVCI